MRFIYFCLIFLVSSISCFAGHEAVAMIKNLENKVIVQRESEQYQVSQGFKLFETDILLTEKGASAGIIFNDNTLVTLGENTKLVIEEYIFKPKKKEYGFKMYLKSGSAIYSSGKMGKLSPESIKFKTPKATVGVRGTKFLVKVD